MKKYNFNDNDFEFIKSIIEWNKNKNMVLWPFNINENNLHENVLDVFYDYSMVDKIPYKIIKFKSDNDYKKYIIDNNNFNIILSVLYLEPNIDNHLIVRNGKLNEFIKTKYDKDIKILEVHLSLNNQVYSNLNLKTYFKNLILKTH